MIYLFSKNIWSSLISYWLLINIWLTTVKKTYIWFTSKSISTFMFILFSLPWMQSVRIYAFKLRMLIWLKIILNSKSFRPFSMSASLRSLLDWIEASVNLSMNTSIFMNNFSFLNCSNCSNQLQQSSASSYLYFSSYSYFYSYLYSYLYSYQYPYCLSSL